MRRTSLIPGSLAIAFLASALFVSAEIPDPQDPCWPTLVTVPAGVPRAALEEGAEGVWTFTVSELSPKARISSVWIQIYENALPTSGEQDPTLYAVCASCGDPEFQRPQADCGTVCEGNFGTAGSLKIKKVTVGAAGKISLAAGTYCVRVGAFGSGRVTVLISPP